jgi:hypothetical protein
MSRFGDTMRKALSTTPPALGFRPAASAKPRMLLVAAINEMSDDITALVEGADAVILGNNIKIKEAKNLAKTITIPWGVWIDGGAQSARQAETAGADFLVFDPGVTGIDIMSNERPGKVLTVDVRLENTLLHGLNELPVDAIYLQREPGSAITWLDLMQFRRLADMIVKPLLVPVAPDVPMNQLKTLWDTGVDAVVIPALTAGAVAEKRQGMDGLALTPRRKWLRARPLVSVISSAPASTQQEAEPEEEEEEEE